VGHFFLNLKNRRKKCNVSSQRERSVNWRNIAVTLNDQRSKREIAWFRQSSPVAI